MQFLDEFLCFFSGDLAYQTERPYEQIQGTEGGGTINVHSYLILNIQAEATEPLTPNNSKTATLQVGASDTFLELSGMAKEESQKPVEIKSLFHHCNRKPEAPGSSSLPRNLICPQRDEIIQAGGITQTNHLGEDHDNSDHEGNCNYGNNESMTSISYYSDINMDSVPIHPKACIDGHPVTLSTQHYFENSMFEPSFGDNYDEDYSSVPEARF